MLNIQKATAQDANSVWRIRNAAILDQCSGYYPANTLNLWTSGELTKTFIADVEENFYIAFLMGQTVGTGKIDLGTGKLDAIFVHPKYMRTGIDRQILNYLQSLAIHHGLKSLSLESTLNAAEFYRACGFEGDKIQSYHSPRGLTLDCIPMQKRL